MVICHIMCEFCIVDVKLIVFVSDKSPVEGMLRTPIDGYNYIEKVSNNDEFYRNGVKSIYWSMKERLL